MISHAPAHAFSCATHVALFGRAGQFSVGDVDSMLTEERLSAVYEIPVRILTQVTAQGVLRTCLPESLT
jgi:iron complex transport system ATP-binding protein